MYYYYVSIYYYYYYHIELDCIEYETGAKIAFGGEQLK